MLLGQGNFVGTAYANAPFRSAAALGLIGTGTKALDALAAIDIPEARLYHAIALWIDGQDDEAARQLAYTPPSPASEELQTLLRKDRIHALCFLPPHSSGPHGIFAAPRTDPRLDIRNIWFHAAPEEGIANQVDADIHHFFRRHQTPDLLIAEMVEWHVLPRNLAEAPCFKVGHTSDFDLHGQEVMPWLTQFDTILTLDHTEWEKLRRALPGHPVMTYPKAFTVRERALPLDSLDRPIDVLMTGTVLSDFHQDKNELVTRLAHLPGVRSLLLNGFVSHQEYEAITARSKMTLSFVRHSGTMPTRALESLAMGTWSILQDDSALRLYLPEDAAILPYRHGDWASFEKDITEFVRRFPERQTEYAERARKTAEAVFSQFNPERVSSQYFRFCAALPAIKKLLGMGDTKPQSQPEIQKRGCVVKGWLPANGEEGVLHALLERNVARLKDIGTAAAQNQIGREYLIEYARLTNKGQAQPVLLQSALTAFSAAVAMEPAGLAQRFNQIRALYHFGSAVQQQQAETLAHALLAMAQEPGALHLEVLDDLLPYDFYPSHINGQACTEFRLAAFGGSIEALNALRALIIASVHYYLARGMGNKPAARQHFKQAIDLDPENQQFQIGYSLYLLATQAEGSSTAKEFIAYTAQHAQWTPMLGNLGGQMNAGARKFTQNAPLFFDIEDEIARQYRFHMGRNLTMSGERYRGLRNISDTQHSHALILCGSGIITNPKLPEALRHLRRQAPQVEIAVIDTLLDVSGSPLADCTDILVSAPQAGTLAYSSMVIAGLLPEIRAPYSFIAQPELNDQLPLIEQVIRFVETANNAIDLTSHPRRPLLLTRRSQKPGIAREILCVGAATEFLRSNNLPQRTGMLQAANLTLPILMHLLRNSAESFYLASLDMGQIYPLANNDPLLDLADYVEPLENQILQIISPNWRRMQETMPSVLRQGAALVTNLPIVNPYAASPGTAPPPQLATIETGDNHILAFGRDSFAYRLARRIYHRYLRRNNLQPENIDPREMAINLLFLRFEYAYPQLRVKLRLPGRGPR